MGSRPCLLMVIILPLVYNVAPAAAAAAACSNGACRVCISTLYNIIKSIPFSICFINWSHLELWFQTDFCD